MARRRSPCCSCCTNIFHMLGLRYNPFGRHRKRPKKGEAPPETGGTFPLGPKDPPIDTKPSISTAPTATRTSPAAGPVTPVKEHTMMSPILSTAHRTNGLHMHTPPQSPRSLFNSKTRVQSYTSTRTVSGNYSSMNHIARQATNGYKIGFVQETATSLKRRSMSELGAGVHENIAEVSFVSFLEWIRSERLTTLPHKGSRWDKVLIRALYFAEQLHNFDMAIQAFALDSSAAATLGYGHAQLLLELGHENSAALDMAFTVFYKFALSFSSVLHRSELLAATAEIREQLCFLYTDLLSLVVDVAIRFYKTANGMTASSVSLDIFDVFGDTIQAFRTRQNDVIESIWNYQIEHEAADTSEAPDVKVLSRWLAPQDRVLATLSRDHATFADNQAEFTCLWFQKHLTRFVQSEKNFFLVTGELGSGKTVLAGSIVERLQRPLNRKTFDTIFCSVSPDIPTHATSLAVVKSLLFQLLNLRVGNMVMYYALSQAYEQCRNSADVNSYEEYLWQALVDMLSHPVDGGNDLIIVVDGLDELNRTQKQPSALLEKLLSVIDKGRRVRLIVLSTSLSTPAHSNGTHYQITRDDVHDDLHAVALKDLAHNHNFHNKPGPEQESLLGRIIHAANGSFLWTILACEMLNLQKSGDGLTKTLENLEASRPSVQDLVLKLFTSLEMNNNGKTLLSWMLAAERPFTVEEIHSLFNIDTHKGVLTDKGVDSHAIIHSMRPLLAIHERIVRFRHSSIESALQSFAEKGKLPLPVKESQSDLVLRLLTYAKSTLREKGEPVMDNSDPSLADRLFHQHHFLEYVVRYWVIHLKQSALALKPNSDIKSSTDLQTVLPDTTILPILEQICWDIQWSIPQAAELHVFVGTLRRQVLTENHPAVLQTYLACATCYSLINNTSEAQKYYYLSTKISRTVLSDIHPLTIECANFFLTVSESMTSTTRTETMTHREEILLLIITAYERQHGSTSELVIRTRKLLAELYVSINEEQRAMEVYRLIQEATIKHYGKHSHEAQDINDHLSVVLGKGKGDRYIDSYKESFFTDEDEEEIIDIFDLDQIAVYLRRAEAYLSRGEAVLAEKTYVELWLEISSKCRTVHSIEWHEKHIDVAMDYSRFLQSQKRTIEASAVLTCVWQQYEAHQLSFTESIISRLTNVAKVMRLMGHYTMALSIFKYASSYYKNVRREESQASIEINKEVSETSTELVKQSLSSSTTITETTSTVAESVFQDVFHSVIKSSKTVDSTTVALAKKLTKQYMEQRNWSAAVSVIQATLQRTWSSFLSSSIHDVTLTSTFTHESVELVEHLAECYLHMKQLEKVEDVYTRLFRAVLTSQNTDDAVFEKAKTLLVGFYDKHGYADSAISIFQEILVVYRTRLGSTHTSTIQTLYILASRCRAHPRNHPYWIEYYLQIVTSLNKDSDVCHKDAMDAIIIVANNYWEDRRYAEAVTVFKVLWNTFVRKTKEYKQFSETSFVQVLYERYFQSLEETKASWDVLHKVTKEYRETSIATFGASSTISIEATLALARVSQRSEEHAFEAISLYEEASKSSKIETTTVTEIKQTLSSLYVRQMQSTSSTSVKTETIERAISMTQEQYSASLSKYGYSHESSLTHLRELAVLYHRQQKTDVAIQKLTTAATEIITKEKSSRKMIEAAASIAASFHACKQVHRCTELIQELHRQMCAKDARYTSKWSFNLIKCDRSALAFLASLQYNVRKDLSITFAEVMADITMEYIYYELFRHSVKSNEGMAKVLVVAAPLRSFLLHTHQREMAVFVEEEVINLFLKADAATLNVLSKDSPRIFIVAILEYLGNGKGKNKNFNRAVILASNTQVASLTKSFKFQEAYDIAHFGFLFATKHDGYNGPKAIGQGFKLASLLVGREGEKCSDPGLRRKSLDLSNRIVKKILEICKQLKINFAQIQLFELSQLSALLGEQQDYSTLEWLLTTLWSTRDAQRKWAPQILTSLGRRLICARYLAGHPIKAIRLCEDIAYNMRRAHGPRAPITIETYDLLAKLYTSSAQSYQKEKNSHLSAEYFKKALGIHEDLLRLLVYEHGEGDDSDDELDTTAALLAEHGGSVNGSVNGSARHSSNGQAQFLQPEIDRPSLASRHLRLLKLSYQRLGSWPKPYEEYERLNADVFRVFGDTQSFKGIQGVEKWSAKEFGHGKAESQDGVFDGVTDWAFVSASATESNMLHEKKGENGTVEGLGIAKANGHSKLQNPAGDPEDDEEL